MSFLMEGFIIPSPLLSPYKTSISLIKNHKLKLCRHESFHKLIRQTFLISHVCDHILMCCFPQIKMTSVKNDDNDVDKLQMNVMRTLLKWAHLMLYPRCAQPTRKLLISYTFRFPATSFLLVLFIQRVIFK